MNFKGLCLTPILILVSFIAGGTDIPSGATLGLPDAGSTPFPRAVASIPGGELVDLWDEDPLSSGWVFLIDGIKSTPADESWVRDERVNEGTRRITYSNRSISLIQEAVVSGEGSHVRVNVSIVNTGEEDVAIVPSLLLDTVLGEPNGLPFLLNDGTYPRSEVQFTGREIPRWIKSFRNNRTPALTLILDDDIPTAPESVAMANWLRMKQSEALFEVENGRSFDYLPFSEGDTAVLLTWKEQKLAGGASYDISLLYGLDENAPEPELFNTIARRAVDSERENARLREYTLRQRIREINGIIDEIDDLLAGDESLDEETIAGILGRTRAQQRLRGEYENL